MVGVSIAKIAKELNAFPANGVRIQFRETTGAVTTGYTPTEITGASTMQTPAKLRLVKAHGKIQMFINDIAVQIPDKEVDVSDWGSELCVGIGVTSHNNARLCPVMVNDLTFSFSYPKGTTLMLK